MNSWQDCGVTYEGCACPVGQVLSQDVSYFNPIIRITVFYLS
jgi:hypothetical protein